MTPEAISAPNTVPYDPSVGISVTLNPQFQQGIYMPAGSVISAGAAYPLPIIVTVEKRDAPYANYKVVGCPVTVTIISKTNAALNLILLDPSGYRLPAGTQLYTDLTGTVPVSFTIVGGVGQVEMRLTTGLVLASSQYAMHTDFPLTVNGPAIPAPPPPLPPSPPVITPPPTPPPPALLTTQQVLDIWEREGWWVGKVVPAAGTAVTPGREWAVCLNGLILIALGGPLPLNAVATAINTLGLKP